jgi:hypothetical protein
VVVRRETRPVNKRTFFMFNCSFWRTIRARPKPHHGVLPDWLEVPVTKRPTADREAFKPYIASGLIRGDDGFGPRRRCQTEVPASRPLPAIFVVHFFQNDF